jgi:hypothetical protein
MSQSPGIFFIFQPFFDFIQLSLYKDVRMTGALSVLSEVSCPGIRRASVGGVEVIRPENQGRISFASH